MLQLLLLRGHRVPGEAEIMDAGKQLGEQSTEGLLMWWGGLSLGSSERVARKKGTETLAELLHFPCTGTNTANEAEVRGAGDPQVQLY